MHDAIDSIENIPKNLHSSCFAEDCKFKSVVEHSGLKSLECRNARIQKCNCLIWFRWLLLLLLLLLLVLLLSWVKSKLQPLCCWTKCLKSALEKFCNEEKEEPGNKKCLNAHTTRATTLAHTHTHSRTQTSPSPLHAHSQYTLLLDTHTHTF